MTSCNDIIFMIWTIEVGTTVTEDINDVSDSGIVKNRLT